jgi:hypothetical protein
MHACIVAWPTYACVEGGSRRMAWHGMPAEQPTTTTIMYASASPPPQQCIHPGQCEGHRCPSTSFVHGRACPAGLDMRMSPHKHSGRTHRVHAHTLAAGTARDEVGLKYGTSCANIDACHQAGRRKVDPRVSRPTARTTVDTTAYSLQHHTGNIDGASPDQ